MKYHKERLKRRRDFKRKNSGRILLIKYEGTQTSTKQGVSDKGRIRRPTDGKQITGKASIIMVLDRYVGYIYGLARVC